MLGRGGNTRFFLLCLLGLPHGGVADERVGLGTLAASTVWHAGIRVPYTYVVTLNTTHTLERISGTDFLQESALPQGVCLRGAHTTKMMALDVSRRDISLDASLLQL